MAGDFSMGDSIRFGWNAVWANTTLLAQGWGVILVLTIARVLLMAATKGSPLVVLVAIIFFVAELVVGIGLTVITLKIGRGKPAHFRDIIPDFATIVRYLAANLLAGLLVLIGLIVLIVPGVYLLLRFSMVKFVSLEEKIDVFAILSQSSHLTEGVKWRILGFILVLIGVNILGALALLVGLLVTIPLSMIAFAHVYGQLLQRHHTHAH